MTIAYANILPWVCKCEEVKRMKQRWATRCQKCIKQRNIWSIWVCKIKKIYIYIYGSWLTLSEDDWGLQSPPQRIVLRFDYHSQKVIGPRTPRVYIIYIRICILFDMYTETIQTLNIKIMETLMISHDIPKYHLTKALQKSLPNSWENKRGTTHGLPWLSTPDIGDGHPTFNRESL